MQELQNRLNAAATKAGLPAGYELASYTDNTDGYADYVGYTVTGPDVERAHKFLVTTVHNSRKGMKPAPASSGVTRYAEVRTVRHTSCNHEEHDGEGCETTFVCTHRFSLGD